MLLSGDMSREEYDNLWFVVDGASPKARDVAKQQALAECIRLKAEGLMTEKSFDDIWNAEDSNRPHNLRLWNRGPKVWEIRWMRWRETHVKDDDPQWNLHRERYHPLETSYVRDVRKKDEKTRAEARVLHELQQALRDACHRVDAVAVRAVIKRAWDHGITFSDEERKMSEKVLASERESTEADKETASENADEATVKGEQMSVEVDREIKNKAQIEAKEEARRRRKEKEMAIKERKRREAEIHERKAEEERIRYEKVLEDQRIRKQALGILRHALDRSNQNSSHHDIERLEHALDECARLQPDRRSARRRRGSSIVTIRAAEDKLRALREQELRRDKAIRALREASTVEDLDRCLTAAMAAGVDMQDAALVDGRARLVDAKMRAEQTEDALRTIRRALDDADVPSLRAALARADAVIHLASDCEEIREARSTLERLEARELQVKSILTELKESANMHHRVILRTSVEKAIRLNLPEIETEVKTYQALLEKMDAADAKRCVILKRLHDAISSKDRSLLVDAVQDAKEMASSFADSGIPKHDTDDMLQVLANAEAVMQRLIEQAKQKEEARDKLKNIMDNPTDVDALKSVLSQLRDVYDVDELYVSICFRPLAYPRSRPIIYLLTIKRFD